MLHARASNVVLVPIAAANVLTALNGVLFGTEGAAKFGEDTCDEDQGAGR